MISIDKRDIIKKNVTIIKYDIGFLGSCVLRFSYILICGSDFKMINKVKIKNFNTFIMILISDVEKKYDGIFLIIEFF